MSRGALSAIPMRRSHDAQRTGSKAPGDATSRVMGHQDVWFDPSAHAVALGIVDGMPASWRGSGGYGRGERGSDTTIHLTGRRRRLAAVRSA